jgi:hypothetical protein
MRAHSFQCTINAKPETSRGNNHKRGWVCAGMHLAPCCSLSPLYPCVTVHIGLNIDGRTPAYIQVR